MTVLQVNHRLPVLEDPENTAKLLDAITDTLKRAFYEALDEHLAETPGGILLGPLKVTTREEDDWLLGTGKTLFVNVSAHCEDLPEPPEYKFFGGPVDGRVIRTNGSRYWLVPQIPPPSVLTSYVEPVAPIMKLVAEYERQGNTSAYFYKRSYEQ